MKHAKLLSLLSISALSYTLFIPHISSCASEDIKQWTEISIPEASSTQIDPRGGKEVDPTYGTADGPTLLQQVGGWWTNLKGTLGQATEQAQQVATGAAKLASEFANVPYDNKVQEAVDAVRHSIYYNPDDRVASSFLPHEIYRSLDQAKLQEYLKKAKEIIEKTANNYISYLTSKHRTSSDNELSNSVSFLKNRIEITLQPLLEKLGNAEGHDEESAATEPLAS